MSDSPYVIGIDLGTTNSSVAYIERGSRSAKPVVRFLDIPQVVAEGEVGDRAMLPSFLYFPGQFEVPAGAISLPWNPDIDYVAGEFARAQAARIVGKVVSSAKSWLCHRLVDRTAKILPWGSRGAERTVSPIEASSHFLGHLRDAWNHRMAARRENRMENQEIVLTVPASFDEVARELTLEAARDAGLERIILLEEPQAAFYSWLLSYETSWRKYLKNVETILIFDVGGGTTDFTLIRVERSAEELSLKRVAVGDHLLLGGDNIDLAIARYVESRFMTGEEKLDSQRWALLCHECRSVKELALQQSSPESFAITIPGRGSRLVGGAVQAELSREEIVNIMRDGFFPEVGYDEALCHATGLGLKEWGLPYASDPAITRHAASFLRTHLKNHTFPDALMFNGGALKPGLIQDRVLGLLQQWCSSAGHCPNPIKVLANKSLDLAVSRGAAYFALVRQGIGVRIGGGIPRSYYVGIDLEKPEPSEVDQSLRLLCLIPKDLPTEREVDIQDREFSLIVGRPVSFPLFTSTSREEDTPGQILEISPDRLEQLPSLFMVLGSRTGMELEIPVHLKAWVTEIGTLELWCVSRSGDEKWKLQFALQREAQMPETSPPPAAQKMDPELLKKTRDLVISTFMRKPGRITSEDVKPRGVLSALEDVLGEKREEWSTALNRELFDALLKVITRRRSDPQYESSWMNIAGFALRPGFGYPLDDWRTGHMWEIFPQWLQFNRDPQCRLEWWIMWRRVAGGLSGPQQEEMFARISPYYFAGMKHIKSFSGPPPNRIESQEVLRMAACLERISKEHKLLLGNYIMDHLKKKQDYTYYWVIARIGARIPFAGSIHHVVNRETVSRWIEQILALSWHDPQQQGFALSRLSRLTGDRERDIDEALRMQVTTRMKEERCDEALIAPVIEVIEERSDERNLVFGESLPPGLVLKESSLPEADR